MHKDSAVVRLPVICNQIIEIFIFEKLPVRFLIKLWSWVDNNSTTFQNEVFRGVGIECHPNNNFWFNYVTYIIMQIEHSKAFFLENVSRITHVSFLNMYFDAGNLIRSQLK